MLLELGKPQLTHELLVKLLAEITTIVNARPIYLCYQMCNDVQDYNMNLISHLLAQLLMHVCKEL